MTVEAVELSLQEREFCQPPTRWLLVLFTGLIMFGNHYARDAVGALEIQIESDLLISSDQYATINSIYFFPSIVAPLLAGVFTNYIGGAGKCLLYGVISSSIGHVIFSIGIEVGNIYLVFLGRAISGMSKDVKLSLTL